VETIQKTSRGKLGVTNDAILSENRYLHSADNEIFLVPS
jgi:hypothetical protein